MDQSKILFSNRTDQEIMDLLVKDEYVGISLKLWESLRQFHDDDSNFDEYNISESGEMFLGMLTAEYCNEQNY